MRDWLAWTFVDSSRLSAYKRRAYRTAGYCQALNESWGARFALVSKPYSMSTLLETFLDVMARRERHAGGVILPQIDIETTPTRGLWPFLLSGHLVNTSHGLDHRQKSYSPQSAAFARR